METNIKNEVFNPIHIEFYGLPGCGKSTISHKVAEQLRLQGINVCEPSFVYDHKKSFIYRKIYKLFSTIFFFFTNYNDYRFLRHLTKENGYTKFKESMKQIINIVPKVNCYNNNDNNKNIYLWDEGLVQSAISLALNNDKDIKCIERQLYSIISNRRIIKIYLRTDVKTALDRMDKRNTNDSRIEQEIDKEKKMAMMKRFEDCCENVDRCYLIKEHNIDKTVNMITELIERTYFGGVNQ